MGYANITKHHIRGWILAQLEDRWKGTHMSGDEALDYWQAMTAHTI